MEPHGLLPIDKPVGWTSHDVVGRVRRILGTPRVGHAGTLDPAATGVLVVGVGRATRFLDYVQAASKEYVAHVVLGIESESADIDGRLVPRRQSAFSISEAAIEDTLQQFLGDIDQIPPKYSAIKIGGEALYRRARRGEVVDVPSRRVRVDGIQVVEYSYPDLVLSIECGSGVYVRSLARDIGEALGCGAYLHRLLRTRVGSFTVAKSWSLGELDVRSFPRDWAVVASAIDAGLGTVPALRLKWEGERSWYHGRSIRVDASGPQGWEIVRAYTGNGDFAGLGSIEHSNDTSAQIRPRIVLTAN